MTSLQRIKRKNGAAWRIQFFINGERKTLYLGVHYTRAHAVEIDAIVKKIVDATIAGVELDASARAWLDRISDDLRERFERAGLLAPRKNPRVADVFAASQAATFPTLSAATQNLRAYLCARFLEGGGDVRIDDLTDEKIVEIRANLDARYSQATRANCFITAKTAFNWAIRAGLIEKNPLRGVAAGSRQNKAREYFIARADALKIYQTLPTREFRALFALYRWGGLRRGEAFALRWRDVDFQSGRLRVPSPKTARTGAAQRVIPLFPEVRAALVPLRDSARPESPVVAEALGKPFRAALRRAILAAGLEIWPRLLQNLRASRSNEIYRDWTPLHEAAWIGHSVAVAREHYLAITPDDFEQAARGS